MPKVVKKCRRVHRRHLIDGSTVPELLKGRLLTLDTRCPAKWLVVDLETGQVFRQDRYGWRLVGHVSHGKDKYIIQ